MREHQAFILVLSFVFVSIAVFAGFQLYSSYELTANKGAIVNTLTTLAEDAHQFRARPVAMGGGGGSYTRYSVPFKLIRTEDGIFTTERAGSHLLITGISRPLNGRIIADVDENGNVAKLEFEGVFR
jgi:hypothetical protein